MNLTKNNIINLQEAPSAIQHDNKKNSIKFNTYLNNENNLKTEEQKNIKSI